MRDAEFAELVTLAIESLKEETVHQLLQSNADYQRECEEEGMQNNSISSLNFQKNGR